MATHRIPADRNLAPDGSAFIFPADISTQLTLTNSKEHIIMVMQDPNGAGDVGFMGKVHVPKNFSSAPILVARYVIDGTPASVVAFGVKILALADSEAFDAAYGTQNLASNSNWTGYADEDVVQEKLTIADTLAPDDDAFYLFEIDDSVHTFTGNVLVTGLFLEYSD